MAPDSENTTAPGPESRAQELKLKANDCYGSQKYEDAERIYTSILETCQGASKETVTTARCNRAACFLELGKYKLAADDCTSVISASPSKTITLKARFRLARSLERLGKLDEALDELDKFQSLNGGPTKPSTKIRVDILERQAANDSAADGPGYPTRPIRYMVKPLTGDHPAFVINEQAPIAFCGPSPPEFPTKVFLAGLIQKHDPSIMQSRQWMCWNCEKKADSIVHTPCSYLHLADPMVLDYLQPVCKRGGPCEVEARAFIAQTMEEMAQEAAGRK